MGKNKQLHPNKVAGKETCQFSTTNFYTYTDKDSQTEGWDSGSEQETQINTPPDYEYDDTSSDKSVGLSELEVAKKRKALVLGLLYIEKFVEIGIVFGLTLLTVLWSPLNNLVAQAFWPLCGFIVISMISLVVLYRSLFFRRCPGFLFFKLVYFSFLTGVFLLLAVHAPKLVKFLSAYFALVAAGSIAATYMLFAFFITTHTHLCGVPAKGFYLWMLVFTIPIILVILNQPVYFSKTIWHFRDYWNFTINVAVGISLSVPFAYEAVDIYHIFVISPDLQSFIRTQGLLPGFVLVYFTTTPEKAKEAALETIV